MVRMIEVILSVVGTSTPAQTYLRFTLFPSICRLLLIFVFQFFLHIDQVSHDISKIQRELKVNDTFIPEGS